MKFRVTLRKTEEYWAETVVEFESQEAMQAWLDKDDSFDGLDLKWEASGYEIELEEVDEVEDE